MPISSSFGRRYYITLWSSCHRVLDNLETFAKGLPHQNTKGQPLFQEMARK
jgi:hypothetical protein